MPHDTETTASAADVARALTPAPITLYVVFGAIIALVIVSALGIA